MRPMITAPVVFRYVRSGRYGDEAGDRAVQAGEEVHASQQRPGDDESRHDAAGGGQSGVGQHVAHRHGIGGAS